MRVHKANELNIIVTKEGYIDYNAKLSFKDAANGIDLTILKATKLNLIKKKGVLTIGVSKNHLRQYRSYVYYPHLSVDIEIWQFIASSLGVKLDVKFYKDTELVTALKNKEVDLILSNEQFIKNSDLLIGMSYYDTSQVACIKVENTSVKMIKDLAGKKIGVARDSQAGIEAVKSIKGIPVFYDTYSAPICIDLKPFQPITAPIKIDKPINVEIDASLFDKFVTEYNGIFDDQLKLLNIKSGHDNFVFASLQDDTDFVEAIKNIIKNSYQDYVSKYKEIADNCFWMYME